MTQPVSAVPALHAKRIVFTGKQQLHLEAFDHGQPAEGQVLIRTEFSLMSTGTENIVFNRNFDAGTHWDNWVKYPFYPGYTAVGTIAAMGPEVTTRTVGQRVAFRIGHRSHAIMKATDTFPIPDDVTWEQAAWFSLVKIAFMGARAAAYTLGDTVLIIGAGPIGQMSVRWARAAGAASIIVVDPVPGRLKNATEGGATAVISLPISEAREAILAANGGKLPRVVIDGTGHAAVFASALTLAARFGTVVVLGDTGQPTQQTLTTDVINRGLRIIGAHDGHGNEEWNDATITELFFSLNRTDRFPMQNLTSHIFTPEQCEEAYTVANRDRASTMGILFDWRNK
ncbi:MAG: zinc-binding dehydrogenase [Candidatus Methylacidiphilales bacterium]|nr:zinc-binding alcohol dehydrogenase [Candidatus Methylacidiphilales bacterium]